VWVNNFQSIDIGKIFFVVGDEREVIDQGSSCDDGIGQFYFVLLAYVCCLNLD